MKHENWVISGNEVKNTLDYVVTDNTDLKKMVVSSTRLFSKSHTRGHTHDKQEEVYMFVEGYGNIELGTSIIIDSEQTFRGIKTHEVEPGTIVTIPAGTFHRVINTGDTDLYFVCVFNGRRDTE
jgi:oxalate decarboxylase/phosphoglucose isomerase-like protein (cupin superfamily)